VLERLPRRRRQERQHAVVPSHLWCASWSSATAVDRKWGVKHRSGANCGGSRPRPLASLDLLRKAGEPFLLHNHHWHHHRPAETFPHCWQPPSLPLLNPQAFQAFTGCRCGLQTLQTPALSLYRPQSLTSPCALFAWHVLPLFIESHKERDFWHIQHSLTCTRYNVQFITQCRPLRPLGDA